MRRKQRRKGENMQQLLVQSIFIAIVGVIILIVRGIGNKRIHLQVKTMLWLLFFAVCVVPVSLFKTPFGMYEEDSNYIEVIEHRWEAPIQNETGVVGSNEVASHDTVVVPQEEKTEVEVEQPRKTVTVVQVLSYTYFAGLAAIVLFYMIQYSRCIRAVKKDSIPMGQELEGKEAVAYLYSKHIPFEITNSIGPCAVGIWKTKIYIPKAILQRASEEGCPEWYRAMILHEAAHRSRYHFQCLMLMRALCAFYWFHPMVWLMLRFLREDMEVRCDYQAVQETGRDEAAYVGAMLSFAKLQASIGEAGQRKLEISFLNKHGELKKRVKEIFAFQSYRTLRSVLLAVVSVVLIVAVSLLLTGKEGNSVGKQDGKYEIVQYNVEIEPELAQQIAAEMDEIFVYAYEGRYKIDNLSLLFMAEPEEIQSDGRPSSMDVTVTMDWETLLGPEERPLILGMYDAKNELATEELKEQVQKIIDGWTVEYEEKGYKEKMWFLGLKVVFDEEGGYEFFYEYELNSQIYVVPMKEHYDSVGRDDEERRKGGYDYIYRELGRNQ